MYVCVCKAISEKALREAAADSQANSRAICRGLGVGAGCGQCARAACAIIQGVQLHAESAVAALSSKSERACAA